MNLPSEAREALAAFTQPMSWEQRARLLMRWGSALPELGEAERTPENSVSGCESQVWVVATTENGCWHFRASSEARLIRGLIAVLLARVNGLTAEELQSANLMDWFEQLGLSRQLSPSRTNGLHAVIQKITSLSM